MKTRYIIKATCYDKKSRIVSIGYNSYTRTHPLQKHFAELVGLYGKEYLHAEIDALLKAKGKPVYSIVIERYAQDGRPLLAKPCPICETAIRAFGVDHIYFTTGE
jgi:tRNA(Arg) A34 adenosine deaminase TadA